MAQAKPALTEWLHQKRCEPELHQWVEDLLVGLCRMDTTLGSDLQRLAEAERATFDRAHEAMSPYLRPFARRTRLPIPDGIAADPYYTTPYYAGELSDRPQEVYRGRANLLIDSDPFGSEADWVLNAHVDTVPPHVPVARIGGGQVAGRGAADDKGGVATAATVARLLGEWADAAADAPAPPRVRYLFSIDEEMGGNGTLAAVSQMSLATSHVVVLEPTSLVPYVANRGAVWFKISMTASGRGVERRWGTYKEIALAVAAAGRTLTRDSYHPLFTDRDVQTCFGILGAIGLHPSSACTQVDLEWELEQGGEESILGRARGVVVDRLTEAVASGRIRHSARAPEISVFRAPDRPPRLGLSVFSQPGHMGSHDRDSDALVKAAECLDALEAAGFPEPLWTDSNRAMVLEGGQGFLPDREIADVMERLRTACASGLEEARVQYGLDEDEIDADIGFDKLHNAAFCSAPGAVGGSALARATAELWGKEMAPARGWKASCDARIFARSCQDVVTFGPGALEVAHGPDEAIDVAEICDAAAVITHAMLAGGPSAPHV